jgi:hypothetical protein
MFRPAIRHYQAHNNSKKHKLRKKHKLCCLNTAVFSLTHFVYNIIITQPDMPLFIIMSLMYIFLKHVID